MTPAALRRFADRLSAAVEDTWGGTIIIGSQTIPAKITAPQDEEQIVAGGITIQAELIVHIRKENLATPPAAGTIVQARGKKWVVKPRLGSHEIEADWIVRLAPRN